MNRETILEIWISTQSTETNEALVEFAGLIAKKEREAILNLQWDKFASMGEAIAAIRKRGEA